MKLDVGCGNRPTGDVNCDLNKYENPHIHGSSHFVDVRRIPNFVQCDAQHLPFKGKVFQETYCSHVIEHAVNPNGLLEELVRVTNGKTTILCPYRFVPIKKPKHHLYLFNVNWFTTELSKLHVGFSITVSRYNILRSLRILKTIKTWRLLCALTEPLSIPWEIRVKIES